MRCLMGEAHRRLILEHCRPGSRVLEWGMGGTSVWLAERMPADVQFTSIEHDAAWFAQVAERLADRPGCELLLRPAMCPPGRNATVAEESAQGLDAYLSAVDGRQFDVVIVDGVARTACLERAPRLLAPGGLVFLHDAQRPWYDEGKRALVEYGVAGTCPDYPPAWLWMGSADGSRRSAPADRQPLIVSFFTKGTSYEDEAAQLAADCAALGLDAVIEPLSPAGSWARNTNLKADFCRQVWTRAGRPILWVDADARIRRLPALAAWERADLALHKWDDWQQATGTMYFGLTDAAGAYLDAWTEWCRRLPDLPDQIPADLAWEQVSCRMPLRTAWMPRSHYQIFDADRRGAEAVVEHFQASRRFKAEVSGGTATPYPSASPHLIACRRASRPRRWMLGRTDSAVWVEELGAESNQELDSPGPAARPGAWLQALQASIRPLQAPAARLVLDAAARRLAVGATPYAIYGCGDIGRSVCAVARAAGAGPVAYVESEVPDKTTCDGLPVLTPEQACEAGLRAFLLGSVASRPAMRQRLARAARDLPGGVLVEPDDHASVGILRDASTDLLDAALFSCSRGRTLDEHAWLFERAPHLVDAGLCVSNVHDRLLHLDRYRFVGIHVGGRHVLDLSAGTGDGCHWLWRHGYAATVAGLVADRESLAYASRHYASPSVTFLQASEVLRHPTAQACDVVVDLHPAPCGDERLARARALLKPGGCLVLATPPEVSLAALDGCFDRTVVYGQWRATHERPGVIAPVADGPDPSPVCWLVVCASDGTFEPFGAVPPSWERPHA